MTATFSLQIFRSAICTLACLVRINATENCQGDKCNCNVGGKTQQILMHLGTS